MTHKTQKIISTILLAIPVVGGFEILIYILNLNQPGIYLQVAGWIFVYLLFKIVFLFDLHYKQRGSWDRARSRHESSAASLWRHVKILFTAFWYRVEHLRAWRYLRQWLYCLLIPGFIFWATISLFYVKFGQLVQQQTLAVLSSAMLLLYYWNVKEFFFRKKEVVDSDIFVATTTVKIYTAVILYAASLSMLRYFCLHPAYFVIETFCFTFLLLYQAVYQHRLITGRNIAAVLLIALLMSAVALPVYLYWGLNYFTAAVFMGACYNFLWGIFHYRLDGSLTLKVFAEVFLISAIVASMAFFTTNFRARILDGCNFTGITGRTF